MNPTLVRIIRERMQSQTTEQLLDVWVINDRATWSPETFEAVRSILAERGKTDLPPQNDPPPVAQRRTLHNDPVAAYWMEWLRPVLWAGVVVGTIGAAHQALYLWQIRLELDLSLALYRPGTTARILLTAVLPVWLLASSVACLYIVPAARAALVWYAMAAVAVFTLNNALDAWPPLGNLFVEGGPFLALHALVSWVNAVLLPILLLVFLRRPEIRSIFVPRGGAGFEPALAPPTEPPAENASP